MKHRVWSVSLAALVAAGTLSVAAPSAAHAESKKEKLYRMGTYAGAAATAYGLFTNHDTVAALGAAGTYFAHKGWKDEVDDRHDRWGRNWRDWDRGRDRDRWDRYDRYDRRDGYRRR